MSQTGNVSKSKTYKSSMDLSMVDGQGLFIMMISYCLIHTKLSRIKC